MYNSLEDKVLWHLVQKGENQAFKELYERYWEHLYIHASAMTSCDDTAKDIVQEVFVELWDRKEDLCILSSLKSYLYKVVRNKVLNMYAHNKVHDKYVQSMAGYEETGENRTDYLLRENFISQRIQEEVSALPLKMRQIFEMSRNENKTYKEIAEEFNISDKTVKKQVSNALKILKSKLEYTLCYTSLTVLIWLF